MAVLLEGFPISTEELWSFVRMRRHGCMHRVVVLLEGEPSRQSEVLSALEQVFIKGLSILCSVHLSLDPATQ